MKKSLLLVFCIVSLFSKGQSFVQGFEGNFLPPNWDTLNLSGPTPGTVPAWHSSTLFVPTPPAEEGSRFYASTYKAEGNNGTVSTWLFTPNVLLSNGDRISFYTRTLGTGTYPDRLEFRMSTNGPSINAGGTPTSVGDYSVVLGAINPSLTATGYPTTWTKFTYTLSGLPGGGVSGRFAFRYFVTNSGPNGVNGDAVGLDSVYYKSNNTTGINEEENSFFSIYPNPSNGILQLSFSTAAERMVTVETLIGETLREKQAASMQEVLDLGDLPKGIYFLSIRQSGKRYTRKIVLN